MEELPSPTLFMLLHIIYTHIETIINEKEIKLKFESLYSEHYSFAVKHAQNSRIHFQAILT